MLLIFCVYLCYLFNDWNIRFLRWCQQNNVAFMATWHSQYSDYLKFYNMEYACYNVFSLYMKGFYEQIPVVYVPTPYIIKKMEADGLGKHTSIQQWGRGVDLKLFNPNRYSRIFRESKNISENEVVILWVGRLVPEKRPDIYLDIVERLAEEGYPVKGLVVGSGSYEATLAEVKCVTCCGWLAGTALAEAYASCEVLVFPSAVETFGSVTLEALASGCVPIVENNCGKHLVQDKFNGFTCPDGDVEAYYEAAKSLVVDAVMRKKMSVNAREYSKQYDRDVILQQMLEFYKDAIVRHQDPSFIVNHMKADPIASGSGIFATLCCHYYFVKALVYPFMHSANGITNLAEAGKQCMKQSRSKLNLGDYLYSSSTDNIPRDDSRFDDYEVQKKALSIIPHSTHPAFNAVNIMKFADIFATAISYFIVLALIAATFIV